MYTPAAILIPGVLILAAGLALGAHPVIAALPLLALLALWLYARADARRRPQLEAAPASGD